jgi:hypothetical protein
MKLLDFLYLKLYNIKTGIKLQRMAAAIDNIWKLYLY